MKRILALTAAMLLVTSLAFAKDIDTGTIELSGSSKGLFTSQWGSGKTDTILNLEVAGRYYLMPNLGVGGLFDYTLKGGDDDESEFKFGPEAIFNISLDEAVNAYAAINVGYLSIDERNFDDNGLFVGAGAGIKYFFNDSASLNCGLAYQHFFGDSENNTFGLNVGLSIFLK